MTRGARALVAATAAALMLGTGGSAVAGPDQAWYDRTFVIAAHARCRLFDARTASALQVAAAQARSAALRAGVDVPGVNATAARARSRAASVSCRDPDLLMVRDRVQSAYAGWSRLPRMAFEGWQADRVRRDGVSWTLAQTSVTGRSPVTFGVVHDSGQQHLASVVSFVGQPRPVSARLVLRDPNKSDRPWLNGTGLAPAQLRQSIWASGQDQAAANLLTPEASQGQTWLFPDSAVRQIEQLDSRETFLLEFHFRDGTVARASFKAGDLAAGRAFLAMGMI